MIEKKLLIKNPEGMHARPAGVFAKSAAQFKSAVEIEYAGNKKNAKSILSLMSLGLKVDSEFLLKVDGPDEAEAAQTLTKLVEDQFKL